MRFKLKIKQFLCVGLLLTLFSFGNLFAQNYVPNPSFDEMKGKKPKLDPWRKVNTVDYFINSDNKSSRKRYNTRDDKNYTLRKPHSGSGYVGIRTWPKYREYIQVELIDTLSRKKKYYFEMFIALSPYCSCYIKSFAASFYAKRPSYTSGNSIKTYPAQLMYINHKGIRDNKDWVKISGVYKAIGGERYLTIGNFSEQFKLKRKTPFIFSFFKKREAYYYVDDVSLYPLDENGEIQYVAPIIDTIDSINQVTTDSLSLIDKINADSNKYVVFFNENSSKITEEAYSTLGEVVKHLYVNKDFHLKLFCFHKENENETIASARCNQISTFLRGNTIPENKIHIVKEESNNLLYKNKAMIIIEIFDSQNQ